MTADAPDLDPVLHNAGRIAIVARLVVFRRLRFSKLRVLLGITSGNLANHLQSLERAGYVHMRDAIVNKRPGKVIQLSPEGRAAFQRYVSSLDALLRDLATLEATPVVDEPVR